MDIYILSYSDCQSEYSHYLNAHTLSFPTYYSYMVDFKLRIIKAEHQKICVSYAECHAKYSYSRLRVLGRTVALVTRIPFALLQSYFSAL